MRCALSAAALVLSFVAALSADYSNLIATADGKCVYFHVRTSYSAQSSFVVRPSDSGPVVEAVETEEHLVEDVNSSGTILASSYYSGSLICRFPGQTCSVAPECTASYKIGGPGFTVGDELSQTLVRLDRAGGLAWIHQNGSCLGVATGFLHPPLLGGLYETSTLRRVFGSNASLANGRSGRRLISDRGQVLTFAGTQLQWLDAAGAHPIPHVAGAFEAVTDATGNNVVYVEAPVGELHWIAASDEDLGLSGSMPSLSDDGRILAFLGADHSLQIYDRTTRSLRRLGLDTFLEFTLGGNAAFGVTSDGRLVRIGIAAGDESTWLQPSPESRSADAQPDPLGPPNCRVVCYGVPDPGLELSRGMILVLHVTHLDQPGLRARFGSVETPISAISDKSAWLQVPSDLRLPLQATLAIYNPSYPALKFNRPVYVDDHAITCVGTLHSDFSRSVSTADPALPGENVHVYLTGLHGVEPVADGVPNRSDRLIAIVDPPPLADPGAADVLFLPLHLHRFSRRTNKLRA